MPITVSTVTASSFTQRMPCRTVCSWLRPYMSGIDSPVVEEAEMKLALLQDPADVAIVIGRPGVGARLRDGAKELARLVQFCALQEGDQGHLAHCGVTRS